MTPAFPRIELLEPYLYNLVAPWHYKWQAKGAHRELRIGPPFPFDAASVPRPFWWFIAPQDLITAALAHDFLYRCAGVPGADSYFVEGVPVNEPWTRRDVDRLFARIMRECGVPGWRRRMAYRAVRIFGWRFYGKPESAPLRRHLAGSA